MEGGIMNLHCGQLSNKNVIQAKKNVNNSN